MLIVSIIIAFAYYSLTTFQNILTAQQHNKRDQYEKELFLFRIQQDIYNSMIIRYNENYLTCTDSSGNIAYSFQDSVILRNQYHLRTDTFKIQHSAPEITYLGHLQNDPIIVKKISLAILNDGKQTPLTIYKQYDAQQLIYPTFYDSYATD